jgi:hypothetical protein
VVEKFNFYDIYGYLIPGLVLTGLLWLPFGVLWHVWPKAEFSSAILVLLFAYILGHFLQALRVPTSDMQDKHGCWRHPSNVLLDDDNFSLARETKQKIQELSKEHFKIDLHKNEKDPNDTQKHIDGRREAAFFQARSALLKNKGEKTSVYWEQFEGLYAMTRNIMRASALGVFYFLGWSIKDASLSNRIFSPTWLLLALLAAVIFSIARAPRKNPTKSSPHTTATHHDAGVTLKKDSEIDTYRCAEKSSEETWNRRLAWAFAVSLTLIAFFGGGLIARATTSSQVLAPKKGCIVCCTPVRPCPTESGQEEPKITINIGHPAWLMFMLALGAALVSGWAYRAYKEFAKQFALAIWQDFANFEVSPRQAQPQ